MKAIYIGSGPQSTNKGGIKWKLYFFLITFLALTVTVLKVSGPTIVENWINEKGAKSAGYAFSIRDTELKLSKGQIVLNDVKVFNSETKSEILETPKLIVQLSWQDLLQSRSKDVSLSADRIDLILSKDFAAEIKRVQETQKDKSGLYLNLLEGKITQLNIIEKKEDQSRTVVELKDVNFKMKEFSPMAINKKSEFSVQSQVDGGGKLNLSAKTVLESGIISWNIQGSLKHIPAGLLNKISGDKLPFSFNEPSLNAEITAHSAQGKIRGEISPAITRLNLIDEKPGIPTQTIARALNEELTFSLPFTLQDELAFHYSEVFAKLKNYRKYAGTSENSRSETYQSQGAPSAKAKKSGFWPF